MEFDVIIIGAGMAGLTSAIYASRAGFSALVLESGAIGGQILPAMRVENWPGAYGESGSKLMKNVAKQAQELGAEIQYETVERVEEGGTRRFVVKTDENEYACDAVILAVGTKPRKLSKKQERDAGKRLVSYCATCDGALYRDKPVVVVGSGNTAKHEMKYLEGICSKVYHIHHDDPIPKDAEAVFVAIGRVPGTDFLKGFVELDSEGYVVAREDCKTSRAHVYAVGDCRTKSVRQLVTAAGDAAVAANWLELNK